MELFKCPNKCCILKIEPYVDKKDPQAKLKRTKKKAGMFVIDPATGKILVVQSRGKLWGPPKGTIEHEETEVECAIREVKEETGLNIFINDQTKSVKIKGRSTYYYVEIPECEVNIQNNVPYNDVNAIGWIKPKCLGQCIENGNIFVTQQCRIVLSKYLDYYLPSTSFVLVNRK